MNQQQPVPYSRASSTSSLAVLSLVFGISTWMILPFVGALIAVVCGHLARGEIRRAPPGSIEGNGMALAGLLLGYAQLALSVLCGILLVMFIWGLLLWNGQPVRWHWQ